MVKFRAGWCLVCPLGSGIEFVLPRLGSRAPPNFPNCSVKFLKTGIGGSLWELVQLYFHYPELRQNCIQKTGSFLILKWIYELRKFYKGEGWIFLQTSLKLRNSDLHFALHHRTHFLPHCKTTEQLLKLFLAQFQTFGCIFIPCHLVLSDYRTAAGESSCYVLDNQKKYISNNEVSSVPVTGQLVLWSATIHQQNRGRKCFKARLYYFPQVLIMKSS